MKDKHRRQFRYHKTVVCNDMWLRQPLGLRPARPFQDDHPPPQPGPHPCRHLGFRGPPWATICCPWRGYRNAPHEMWAKMSASRGGRKMGGRLACRPLPGAPDGQQPPLAHIPSGASRARASHAPSVPPGTPPRSTDSVKMATRAQ